jgi:Asp/Glu/hydantoin racemase
MNVGLIRVITLTDKNLIDAHAEILFERFEMNVRTKCIQGQPEGIHDEETEREAIPKIIDVAKEFEKEGADALLISCAADPGVEECRELVSIPVVGAGSACAAIAYSIGSRIGAIGITDELPKAMSEVLQEKLVCYIKPESVKTTLDLFDAENRDHVVRAALLLREKGCDTIALACTGMSTIRLYKDVEREAKMRVIDPVIAAGSVLSYLGVKNGEDY